LEALTYENILEAATKLLTDNKIKEKAKELSKKFKSEPIDALTKTVNCIEYYLKTNQTCYSRAPQNDVSWFEYLLLDIIFVTLGTLLFILGALYYIPKKIYQIIHKYFFKVHRTAQKKMT
jgi:hypothetical protein